ncbi:MAG: protocatechuate 3,4-dioxygenase [Nitrosomonas sp.]|nr:protocatechuate 3,4-dioxygenase [Nitrosomonas sp.]
MKKISRRNLIKFGMLGSLTSLLSISNGSIARILAISPAPTPSEVEGPFYPVANQLDKDADLTKIKGQNGLAKGQHIIISGQVRDITGQSVKNAIIEIWQANANGRYHHPRDTNVAPLDPNFQGWAIISSVQDGLFRFKTVIPGAYPATKNWIRPPHIHMKISKQGFPTLVTQMYFPDEQLNKTDLLLSNKHTTERSLMMAKKIVRQGNLDIYEYNIVLRKH